MRCVLYLPVIISCLAKTLGVFERTVRSHLSGYCKQGIIDRIGHYKMGKRAISEH